jgi:hypothetical protein
MEGSSFERIPQDVLQSILVLVLSTSEQDDNTVPTLSGSFELMERKAKVTNTWSLLMSLSIVCKSFLRAVHSDRVMEAALSAARLYRVKRLFIGGSMLDVFRTQWKQLLLQIREQNAQESAPHPPPVACGMRMPPGALRPPPPTFKEVRTMGKI